MKNNDLTIENYLKLEEDIDFKNMVNNLTSNDLIDSMNKNLSFGTGGLRAKIGPGFNRINPYTIKKATHAVFNYANKYFNSNSLVAVVAYDTRAYSKQFAHLTANILASLGVKVFLSDTHRPVAILSYAVRELKANFGIMITASHNPREYNGYKIFWDSGEQVVAPHDVAIINEYNKLTILPTVNSTDSFSYFGTNILDSYDNRVIKPLLSNIKHSQNLKITYSPLHGAGHSTITNLLDKYFGKNNLHVIENDIIPLYNLSTNKVLHLNPEEDPSFTIAIAEAKEKGSQLVLISDPDADRVGVAILHNKNYYILTGNQVGALVLNYLLNIVKPSKDSYMVSTLVTSNLATKIAKDYGLKTYRVETGFKNIANKIASDDVNFFFAMEESMGYLATNLVRDKDGVSSSLLIAQMVSYYLDKGQTLLDVLDMLYTKYNYHQELTLSYSINNIDITKTCNDLELKFGFNNKVIVNQLVEFSLGNIKIFIRASGTEPKIKFYLLGESDFNQKDNLDKELKQIKEQIETYYR